MLTQLSNYNLRECWKQKNENFKIFLKTFPYNHPRILPEDGDEFLEDAEEAGDEYVGDDRIASGSNVVGHQRLDALAHLSEEQVVCTSLPV